MSDGRVTVGHCIEGLPMGLFVACRGGAQRVGRLYQESYRSYMKPTLKMEPQETAWYMCQPLCIEMRYVFV